MKYYVTYVEDGSPLIKEFKSEKLRQNWMYDWFLKYHHYGNDNGYEIEFLFEGELTWRDGRDLTQRNKLVSNT